MDYMFYSASNIPLLIVFFFCDILILSIIIYENTSLYNVNIIYMKRGYCIYCKKKLKKEFNNKSIHRSCWLRMRSFDDRIFDSLFCIDRANTPSKCISVKPEQFNEEEEYKSLVEDVKREKQSLINYDDCDDDDLVYDLGGNMIKI